MRSVHVGYNSIDKIGRSYPRVTFIPRDDLVSGLQRSIAGSVFTYTINLQQASSAMKLQIWSTYTINN